jgi:AraC-like DNA-binding protein
MFRSTNYAPPADLTPFVRQFFVFRSPMPAGFVLIDRLVSESAMIRILLQGDWSAKFGNDGEWRSEGPTLLFGPNARSFGVRVAGSFAVVGVAIRPSGWHALFDARARDIADGMFSLDDLWGELTDGLFDRVSASTEDHEIVAAIETVVRARLAAVGTYASDPAMAIFEDIARDDSTMRVTDAAERVGLSGSALERRCRATFGLTPKVILRRSRFLDMAAAVREISHPDDEERAALRFSDQSHLNREFRHFIGMTPGQFEKAQTPLLNAVLKLREDSKT